MLSSNTVRQSQTKQQPPQQQQTRNQEPDSHRQNPSRPTGGEHRSSGSKLIICSPTPSHLMNNHSCVLSQASTDSRTQAPQPVSHDSGTSTLLTFLSGSDHSGLNTDVPPKRSHQNRRISESVDQSTSDLCGISSISTKQENNTLLTSSQLHSTLILPNYSSVPIVENSAMKMRSTGVLNSTDLLNPSSTLLQSTGGSENHIRLSDNISPTSSDSNIPMESCFANIFEDQGSDSFDLNNITPSIQLTTPVDVSDGILDCAQPSTLSVVRSQSSTVPSSDVHTCSNIRITRPNGDATIASDEYALAKASTSCPAEMQLPLQPLDISPVQASAYCNTQLCASGSGSLGGTNGGADLLGEVERGGTLSLFAPSYRNPTDPRSVWMRDRSKKDSHNRIERKRRDYINCQITELGNLLPEEMFRDGDCKKNKGNILKNSVEFICLLRAELNQLPEIRRETTLAAKVIGQLVKRIQDLEAIISRQSRVSIDTDDLDYQRSLQEWLLIHEQNMQPHTSLPSVTKMNYSVPYDIPDSVSPGLSSVGTEEFMTNESKAMFSNQNLFATSAPTPSAPLSSGSQLTPPMASLVSNISTKSPARNPRTRCTSLTVAGTAYSTTAMDYIQGATSHQIPSSVHPSNRQQRHVSSRLFQQPLFELSSSSSSSTRSPFVPSNARQWHRQQQQQQQRQQPQSTINHPSPQSLIQHSMHRSVEDQTMRCNLSASLPASVQPLLCGLQHPGDGKREDSERAANIYCFGQDDLLSHLKCEPPSDCGKQQHIGHPDQSGYLKFSSNPATTTTTKNNGFSLRPQNNSVSCGLAPISTDDRHPSTRPMHFNWDSPTPIGFEPDDFQFDEDVPME